MEEYFSDIAAMYRDSYKIHGDSPSSLLTPKGRGKLRFRSIDSFVSGAKPTSVLDYGCGLGYLYEYLEETKANFVYSGRDMLSDFIDACNKKYRGVDFKEIGNKDIIDDKYDVVFSSGVFNLKTHADDKESKVYAYDRLKHLYTTANDVLICDFLSEFVDFKQEGSQHFSMDEIANFCVKNLNRCFQIRHDLLPYEFTLVVWKNVTVKRPDNIYVRV